MRILIDALKVTHLPWPETLVLQSKESVDVDPSDGTSFFPLITTNANSVDLNREMAL
jgi:hypothetical protein